MVRPARHIAPRLRGITIIEALDEPELLGSSLVGDPETWLAWRAFLAVLFGLPLTAPELKTFQRCTGLDVPRMSSFPTTYLICGRGAGKSFIMALIAVYLATFRDWMENLAPGGKPVVMIIAPTREQAKIDLAYIVGILDASPVLRRLVTAVTANSVALRTGVAIETGIANFRSIRGRSIACCLLDEAAFLRSDTSASPDVEVLNAIMPSLGRFGGDAVLLVGSAKGTSYTMAGVTILASPTPRPSAGLRRQKS